MLKDHIQELAKELDFPIEADLPGVYTLPVGEGVMITLKEANETIELSSEFGEIPEMNREESFKNMLHGNLFGQGTEGATLGISENGKRLTLEKLMPSDCSYADFSAELESLCDILEFWKEEVASTQSTNT